MIVCQQLNLNILIWSQYFTEQDNVIWSELSCFKLARLTARLTLRQQNFCIWLPNVRIRISKMHDFQSWTLIMMIVCLQLNFGSLSQPEQIAHIISNLARNLRVLRPTISEEMTTFSTTWKSCFQHFVLKMAESAIFVLLYSIPDFDEEQVWLLGVNFGHPLKLSGRQECFGSPVFSDFSRHTAL